MKARIQKIRHRLRFMRAHRFARNERGTQLAELAIVLPVLLLLFGATAEFGRFFYQYTTLAKATRAATRYLVTADVSSIEDAYAKNIAVYGNKEGTGAPVVSGLATGNVTITRAGGAPSVPQTVKVQITGYKFQPYFDLAALTKTPALSLKIDVQPSVTMRYLLTTPLI
ncbi:MAG: TadE/TadG family type IV pilus assembly protein [Pyrinomonadaceae bacterium]